MSTAAAAPTRAPRRLAGPDVVRGAAMIGVVVMNYRGYLVLRGGSFGSGAVAELTDPWAGPLATRFAATFVLVAGVGVTLLTRRARRSAERRTEMRWRLARRGTLLYVVGLFLDEIWQGTIIPYYGIMFVIAAALFTLRARWIAVVGAVAVGAGAAISVWVFWQLEDGHSTSWLTSPADGSLRGYVFDMFVNGTHPLLPWLGFFCCGMLLGRALETSWWRPAALIIGGTLYFLASIASTLASTPFQQMVLATTPASRGVVYVASALGTALVAYAALDWAAEHAPALTDPFRRAGQLALSLYLAHIFVFNGVVDWLGWVDPGGPATSLTFALGFWVVGIVAATWWQRRFGRGPAERIYRAIGG